MLSSPFVQQFDIFKGHSSDLVECSESMTKGTLIFETVEPAFRRIVPAVSLVTRLANHSIFQQQRLKGLVFTWG